jgi:2'-5' RNA ligase
VAIEMTKAKESAQRLNLGSFYRNFKINFDKFGTFFVDNSRRNCFQSVEFEQLSALKQFLNQILTFSET